MLSNVCSEASKTEHRLYDSSTDENKLHQFHSPELYWEMNQRRHMATTSTVDHIVEWMQYWSGVTWIVFEWVHGLLTVSRMSISTFNLNEKLKRLLNFYAGSQTSFQKRTQKKKTNAAWKVQETAESEDTTKLH